MSRGRLAAEWSQTSLLVSLVHNALAGAGKGKPPEHFNPYAETIREKPVIRVKPSQVGGMFSKRSK